MMTTTTMAVTTTRSQGQIVGKLLWWQRLLFQRPVLELLLRACYFTSFYFSNFLSLFLSLQRSISSLSLSQLYLKTTFFPALKLLVSLSFSLSSLFFFSSSSSSSSPFYLPLLNCFLIKLYLKWIFPFLFFLFLLSSSFKNIVFIRIQPLFSANFSAIYKTSLCYCLC